MKCVRAAMTAEDTSFEVYCQAKLAVLRYATS